jgi:hypothetical protein
MQTKQGSRDYAPIKAQLEELETAVDVFNKAMHEKRIKQEELVYALVQGGHHDCFTLNMGAVRRKFRR